MDYFSSADDLYEQYRDNNMPLAWIDQMGTSTREDGLRIIEVRQLDRYVWWVHPPLSWGYSEPLGPFENRGEAMAASKTKHPK